MRLTATPPSCILGLLLLLTLASGASPARDEPLPQGAIARMGGSENGYLQFHFPSGRPDNGPYEISLGWPVGEKAPWPTDILRIRHRKTRKVLHLWQSKEPVATVAIAPNGKWYAIGTKAGALTLYDTQSRRLLDRYYFGNPAGGVMELFGGIRFSDNSRYLVDLTGQNLALWDVTQGLRVANKEQTLMDGLIVGLSNEILAIGNSTDIHILSIPDLKELAKITPPRGRPADAGFSPFVPFAENNVKWAFRDTILTANGNAIQAACSDRVIRSWDLKGKPVRSSPLDKAKGKLTYCFSPQGKTLACTTEENQVLLYSSNGKLLWQSETELPYALAPASFSPNGNQLLFEDNDVCQVLDIQTRKVSVQPVSPRRADRVCLSDQGTWAVTSHTKGTPALDLNGSDESNFRAHLQIHSGTSGIPLRSIPMESDFSRLLGISENGKVISTLCARATVKLYDGQTGKLRTAIKTGQEVSDQTSISHNGRFHAFVRGKILQVWDAVTGKRILHFDKHSGDIKHFAVDPQGSWAVTADSSRDLRLWDLHTGKLCHTRRTRYAIEHLTIAPNGKALACSDQNGTLFIWEAKGLQKICFWALPSAKGLKALRFAPNGKAIYTLYDRKLIKWSTGNGSQLATKAIPGLLSPEHCWISPNGKEMLTRGSVPVAHRWEIAKLPSPPRKEHSQFAQHRIETGEHSVLDCPDRDFPNCLSAMAWSSDEKLLAVGVSGQKKDAIALVGIPEMKPLKRLENPPGAVRAVAFSPDDKTLVALSGSTAVLWDVASGKQKRVFHLGGEWGESVAFSPNGKEIAIAAWKLLFIFDVQSGIEKHRMTFSNQPLCLAQYSPDGKQLWVATRSRQNNVPQQSGEVIVLDRATMKATPKELETQKYRMPYRFSANGKLLLSHDGSQQAQYLYSTESGKRYKPLAGLRYFGAAFLPNEQIALLEEDGLTIRRLRDGLRVKKIGPLNTAQGMTASPSGRYLAILYGTDRVRLILQDLKTGLRRGESTRAFPQVSVLACSNKGEVLVASEGLEGPTCLYSLRTKAIKVLEGQYTGMAALAVSGRGAYVAGADLHGRLLLWSGQSAKVIHSFKAPAAKNKEAADGPPVLLAFTRDEKALLEVGATGKAIYWSVATGKPLKELPSLGSTVTSAALSSNGTWLAAGRNKGLTSDAELILSDAQSGQVMYAIPLGSKREARSIRFSPDGRFLLVIKVPRISIGFPGAPVGLCANGIGAGIQNCPVSIYEIGSGKEVASLTLPNSLLNYGFSPDSRYLYSLTSSVNLGPPDLEIYDIARGRVVSRQKYPRSFLAATVLSPNGLHLLSVESSLDVTIQELKSLPNQALPMAPSWTDKELTDFWTSLGDAKCKKPFRILQQMAQAPDRVMPFLQKHLKPEPRLDHKQLQQWLSDLSSRRFTVREKATLELQNLERLAIPALQKTLKNRPALEVRRRVMGLLRRLQKLPLDPKRLRASRATLVLEWINNPEAKALLQALSRGAPEALVTQEANAVLMRLSSPSKR